MIVQSVQGVFRGRLCPMAGDGDNALHVAMRVGVGHVSFHMVGQSAARTIAGSGERRLRVVVDGRLCMPAWRLGHCVRVCECVCLFVVGCVNFNVKWNVDALFVSLLCAILSIISKM